MEPNGNGTSGVGTYRLRGRAGRTLDPATAAVLVIDPVNDFLAEGEAAWDMTESTVTKHDVIGHLQRLIDGAREHDIPVLYGPMAYTSDDYAGQELHRRRVSIGSCSSSRYSSPAASSHTRNPSTSG